MSASRLVSSRADWMILFIVCSSVWPRRSEVLYLMPNSSRSSTVSMPAAARLRDISTPPDVSPLRHPFCVQQQPHDVQLSNHSHLMTRQISERILRLYTDRFTRAVLQQDSHHLVVAVGDGCQESGLMRLHILCITRIKRSQLDKNREARLAYNERTVNPEIKCIR